MYGGFIARRELIRKGFQFWVVAGDEMTTTSATFSGLAEWFLKTIYRELSTYCELTRKHPSPATELRF